MDAVIEGEFFRQLEKQINDLYPAPLAAQLFLFSHKMFDAPALEELEDDPVGVGLEFLQNFLEFTKKVDLSTPKVKVFNPKQQNKDRVSGTTSIFIIQRDMPFLVDSVRIELNRRKHTIQTIKSTVLNVTRDEAGNLVSAFADEDDPSSCQEALISIGVDYHRSQEKHQELEQSILDVLHDVEVVTDDFMPMVRRLNEAIDEVKDNNSHQPEDEACELAAFLEWMRDDAYILLGCSEYQLIDDQLPPKLEHQADQQLGIFSRHPVKVAETALNDLSPGRPAFYMNGVSMALTKSSLRSRVHRQAYSDYILLKRYNKKGVVIGEHLFMGLYTSRVYTMSPFQIPLIRQRVLQVLDKLGFPEGGHDYKAMCQLIEVHPRDELFNYTVDELYQTLMGIWQINERKMVKFFMRADPFEKFVNCLVYIPRDIYRTSIRERIEVLLKAELDASEAEFNTYFSESVLARTQYVLRINSARYKQIDHRALEQKIIKLTRDWCDDLKVAAIIEWGGEKGRQMYALYRSAFPASYQDHFDHSAAVKDVELFHSLSSENEIAMSFYQSMDAERNVMHFKVFHRIAPLELSSMVPMLENLGFRVIGEHPYQVTPVDGEEIWIHDFTLLFGLDVEVDVSAVRNTFQDAFEAVWYGNTENDSFNHLVVGARLDWRTVAMLRLYARYMKQLGSSFSQNFIAGTLASNLDITRNLVALFRCLFDPKIVETSSEEYGRADRLNEKVVEALDLVSNLNEDKVLRSYLQLINATKRTNFFQPDGDGKHKPYMSVKLSPIELSDVPEPRPLYEIFVYSPRVEGVHLRAGKVARGGLRWSDRLEDYRTEILGLVKAQQVKNAVIVPTGAKGGFVSKQMDRKATREEFLQEGLACYQLFIQGLLDVTDNIVEGAVIPPDGVVRRDYDDPYLVVAADKGTATFSDFANQISIAYDFWLGDAFASGGSHGYDHKKMGITAHGAWVSVQRHFCELGLNTQTDDFSVIGIGDMFGDVFGNGMLMSEYIFLVAAFNHQHIFIDPNPDTAISFAERRRVFELPRSTWEDYDASLISKGGGVFSRGAKSIPLSPEIRARFDISEEQLGPNELIHTLLKAKVDLIWNGGIGTYVKALGEGHQDVGDRANDSVRVNGKELLCRVFGEGGNLGMTQRGRIEFALNGGACNTDFIDNSAGVDCSDHEVNIKILLNELVQSEALTVEQRNQLLVTMTDNVAELVLQNNYRQTQAISLAYYQCQSDFSEFWRFISQRESAGELSRELEYLPDDETLMEREKSNTGLTRPELSVLVSYGKILLKETVLKSNLPEDPYVAQAIAGAFPALLADEYLQQVQSHSLRREIITNQIVNEVVNVMGLTFCQRQAASTGAEVDEVIRAYVVVRGVLGLDRVWKQVEALDYKVPADVQFELFYALMRLGRRTSRWILRNRRSCLSPEREVPAFRPKLVELQLLLPTLFSQQQSRDWVEEVDRIVALNVPQNVAVLVASSNFLYFGFGIADIAVGSGKPVGLVLELYYRISVELDLDWFADEIVNLEPTTKWEDFARESYVDDLESQRRSLANALLSSIDSATNINGVIDVWKAAQGPLIKRWLDMTEELHNTPSRDFAMFSVALRELLDIVQATENRPDTPPVCLV
jgi:glutamate dehydrogenase